MKEPTLPRREFLEMLAGAFAVPAVDWQSLPTGAPLGRRGVDYDVVVIGSGLGGLSCAAAFARQGFKPLVIEQHDKVGGFATAFSRPGGFTFDVSLHSTSVGERDGTFNLIWGFPEITDVEFKLHPHLFRAVFPDHDLRVQQRSPAAFVATPSSLFPEEKAGIAGLFDDMTGLSHDIGRLQRVIRTHGGEILLDTKVEKILVKDGIASGVTTSDGRTHTARAVVSNASPFATLGRMVDDQALVADYLARCRQYSVSLSSFQVFLGLEEDLTRRLGIGDSEVFYEPSYDPESSYERAREADVENGGIYLTLYDNIYAGYSPAGKNTISIMTLQGYDHWERFAKDYHAGEKREYRREKERMAEVLIRRVEKTLLPGLSSAIQVREVGTPLTNVRYTGHHRGAIYGWDQTVDNSGSARVGHGTPIRNLFLAGAWSKPGHGYGAVISSGLECCGEILKGW